MFRTVIDLLKSVLPQPLPQDDEATLARLADFASTLSLYHFTTCPYCLRVRRRMKRLRLDIELRDIHASRTHHDALIAGGGRQTVPCLRVQSADGSIRWMYESADIMRWLDHESERLRRAPTLD